jgi:xylose isomerase
LHTDLKRECDQMAALYKMAVAYKEQKGYTVRFLIEPRLRESTKHRYDYDARTSLAFLAEYGMSDHFKLDIEPTISP